MTMKKSEKRLRELRAHVEALRTRLTTCPLAIYDQVQTEFHAAQEQLRQAELTAAAPPNLERQATGEAR